MRKLTIIKMENVSKFVSVLQNTNDNKNPKDFFELDEIILYFISNNKQEGFFLIF